MLRIILSFLFISIGSLAYSQNMSIEREPKTTKPYITSKFDTLVVGNIIHLKKGQGLNGDFINVKVLNLNDAPVRLAEKKYTSKEQAVKYFKKQDGVIYAFTDLFCINIEAGLVKGEIEVDNFKQSYYDENVILPEDDAYIENLMPYYYEEYLIPFDSVSGEWKYQEVVTIDGSKMNNLFMNAKTWAVKRYHNYKAVMRMEDADAGRLILKNDYQINNNTWLSYVITIDCKDGRYKCMVDDIFLEKSDENRFEANPHVLNALLVSNWDRFYNQTLSDAEKKDASSIFNEQKDINRSINNIIDDIFISLKKEMTKLDDEW
ncbi:DUF4468 domain-containing protein [Dysgonomonas sp. 25]|uniref:DUF4468 domain-containing protein n=1 Tax=Dysgonomonas sp. 25 TaxID=2302933 RepID=UPI0013D4B43C|nr:DUF4468 domain-containing protein [Dysgonomonas sp. 25]NDV70302.1 DUF4468 domain-containing protein [Dysgonomonas sp. 25]